MASMREVRSGELADGWVLAPERYDARRRVDAEAATTVGDAFALVTDTASDLEVASWVLDTSHATDSFITLPRQRTPPGPLGSPKRRIAPGDVLISRLRPYLRQVALVDDALGAPAVCSTEFYVLRARGGLPAAALVAYLLSAPVQAALAAAQEGGHHPRFGRDALLGLPLPASVVAQAPRVAEAVVQAVTAMRTACATRDQAVADVEAALGAPRRSEG
jgi:hypothetical protein